MDTDAAAKPLVVACQLQTNLPWRAAQMFGKGEIPVIIFGILFAMFFVLGAAGPPPAGIYSEYRNYTDALQRAEDNK